MKLMARRNSMITSIGKSRWNMSVCITVLKNSIVFLFFFLPFSFSIFMQAVFYYKHSEW